MRLDYYFNSAIKDIQNIDDPEYSVARDAIKDLFENLRNEISNLEDIIYDKDKRIEDLEKNINRLNDEMVALDI
jgi:predicted  nucleic acid-binding Zn-ribbon protein